MKKTARNIVLCLMTAALFLNAGAEATAPAEPQTVDLDMSFMSGTVVYADITAFMMTRSRVLYIMHALSRTQQHAVPRE